MAIEWMDNFSTYGTAGNMLDGLYAQFNNGPTIVADPSGASGSVLRFLENGNEYVRRVFSGALTTVGIAVKVWLPELPASNQSTGIINFRDNANNTQVALAVTSTGQIAAYRNTTLLGVTPTPVLVARSWQHIEVKVGINDTTGSFKVKVDEITVLDLTNIDTVATANVEVSQVWLGNGNNTDNYMKDLIAWNDLGSVNNDFMGNLSVVTLLPDGDVAFPWTPSIGTTGFDLIDEITPDDADFISADATPPAAAVFSLTNLDTTVTGVKGLQTVVRASKTSTGDANLQVALREGVNDDTGLVRPMTVTPTYWFDISEVSPTTGFAWTPIEVNDAKIVINRTL